MKLLIVDDHAVVREGLAALLRSLAPDTVVLQARDGLEGLSLARDTPDLDAVLLDLTMPGLDGFAAIGEFRNLSPGTPIIVLSASEDAGSIRRALAAGANGYVPKSARPQTLLSAMRLVLSGETYIPPLLVDATAPSGTDHGSGLTPRQLDVLRLLGTGQSNKEIALVLDLSEKTVKAHVTAIFKALDVINRTQAATAARQAGLL